MIKFIIYTLLLNTILSAVEVTQSQQNGIYMEAVLFVGIFGTMGLVSYIYSSRHAKEYKPKKVERKETQYDARIEELLEMQKNNLLSEKEFELLSNYYLN